MSETAEKVTTQNDYQAKLTGSKQQVAKTFIVRDAWGNHQVMFLTEGTAEYYCTAFINVVPVPLEEVSGYNDLVGSAAGGRNIPE